MSLTDDQIVAKNFKKYHEAILPYLNGSAHSGFTPIGTVISVMGTTAPLNYLACDGTVYNIADYSELAAYFNQQFGSSNFFGGDGTTTFAVPDLRGEFLRGTGTNSHSNQGDGANVGVHQDGTTFPNMYNYRNGSTYTVSGKYPNTNGVIAAGNTDKKIGSSSLWGNATVTTTGSDTTFTSYTSRPTNTSVLYCIASKNIFMDAGSNYSTEEQVVGTWIDGKPLYQKTFVGNTGAASTDAQIGTVDNVDRVVNIFGVITRSNGRMDVIPATTSSISVSASGAVTSYTTNNNQTNRPVIITLQYTKTTD